jgi:uracil-DNA glycosylase family 4
MIYCPACPICPHRNPIPPSGPAPCVVLFLAEAPNRHEDATNMPLSYSGQSGAEFNDQYLPLAGLSRDNVHVSNVFICSLPNYKNPTPEQAAICSAKHLPELLERVKPKIIFTMGAIAASIFADVDLQTVHGIPRQASYAGHSFILMNTFHPAFALRSTAAMIPIRSDFEALGRLIKDLDQETFEWPQDPYPTPDYQVIHTIHDLNGYLPRGVTYWDISEDTENSPDGSPFCLTFSHTPGTARLIYASNHKVLQAYDSYMRRFRPLQHMHNWLYDVEIRAKMGLTYTRVRDTMVRAYELGLGGGGDDEENDAGSARGALGLKVLAYRHLHMQMTSFRDTVMPHTLPYVLGWLDDALKLTSARESKVVCMCGHGQEDHQQKGKTKRRTGPCNACALDGLIDDEFVCRKWEKVPQPKPDKALSMLHRKLNTLIQALWDGTGKVDPWKRLKEWPESERGLLEGFLGPMPVMDVGLLPEKDLVGYACRDSDATLRLALWLNRYKIR